MNEKIVALVGLSFLVACQVEWTLPQDQFVSCDTDEDCPEGLTCQAVAELEHGAHREQE